MQAMPTKGHNFQGESCLNFKTSQKQLAVITEMAVSHTDFFNS